jgi:NitT/TauT family transport system permease protein
LQAFLPIVGPIALLLLWELAIAAKWVKPVLLPPPGDTLGYLWQSIISGAIYNDFFATLKRTMYSFFLATVVGVPLGIALGSNEKISEALSF